jgi:hypothetical protein
MTNNERLDKLNQARELVNEVGISILKENLTNDITEVYNAVTKPDTCVRNIDDLIVQVNALKQNQ